MPARNIESISLYPNKKEALSGKHDNGHIEHNYEIISDTIDKEVRTIVLREKDITEQKAKVGELVDLLAQKLGDETTIFKAILKDALTDYLPEKVDAMIKKIKKGEKVSSREGCFHLIIGDGRKRKADFIDIAR